MLECYSSEQITTESTDDSTSADQPPAKKPKEWSKVLGNLILFAEGLTLHRIIMI